MGTKIFLETERLILRELLLSDDKGMFEMDSDAEVQKYLGNHPFTHIEESWEIIEFIRKQYLDNGIGRWAIVNKETGEFMGWGGFKLMTEMTNNHINYHDLGYRLIRRFWGKGYASECAKACVEHGFEKMKLKDIYAMADINNFASRHILGKAGLKYIETFNFRGDPHDWFRISKENK